MSRVSREDVVPTDGPVAELLVAQSPYPMCVVSPQGQIRQWNWGAERLYGHSSTVALGQSLFHLVVPKDREEETRKAMHEALETGTAVYETVRRTAAGEQLEVQAFVVRIRNPDQDADLLGIIDMSQADIKRLERQLFERLWEVEETQAFLNSVLEGSTDHAIVATNRTGVIDLWNAGAQRILGYSADQAVERNLEKLLAPVEESRPVDLAELARRVESSGSLETELLMKAADGRLIPMQCTFGTRQDAHGIPVGFVLVAKDVSSEKAARRALEASEARLREAQELAHIGAWEWDVTNDRFDCADETRRLYGLTSGPPTDVETFLSRVHPQDRDDLRHALDDAAKSLGSFEIEHRVVLPDGTLRWVHARGRGHRKDGGDVRVVGTAQDISARRAVEEERIRSISKAKEIEQLKREDEFRNLFINAAAHELNTPMTALAIQVKLLEDAWDAPDTAGRPDVNVIKRNFERMRRLVEDLLDAARIQADRFTVRRDDVDAARILDDAVATWRPQAEAAGLTVETSWERPLPVSADAQRIDQVVGNMLSNAIKFSPAGGIIRLEAQRTGDEVVVAVTDEGIGLKDEQIQRLFQPFSRVHDEADTQVAGTGMGLFISIGIARAHEGRIEVESPGPGRGTTFRLRLPVTPPADTK